MHGLFACNTAFDHPACHKTTWQGQRRDIVTNQVVPVYNMIHSVLRHQSHKSLLQDAKSYAGTKMSSDHRLVVARANISRIVGIWGKCAHTTTKSTNYATQQLAKPIVCLEYQLHLAQSVADLPLKGKSAQEQWQSTADAIHYAAESTIATVPPTQCHKRLFCPELAKMSTKQRDLCLCINTTTDDQQRQQLKRQCNSVLHALRRKALTNASAALNECAAEVERLHDGSSDVSCSLLSLLQTIPTCSDRCTMSTVTLLKIQ